MSQEYSLPTLMKLYEEALKESVVIQAGKMTTKEPNFGKCFDYLNSHFKLLDTGNYYFLKNDKESKVYAIQDINTLFFNRLPKELKQWCKSADIPVYSYATDVTKPKLFDNKINLFEGFMHPIKPYESYPQEIKDKVGMINSCILEVLCSGNVEVFHYIIKWYANMIKGNKNNAVPYFKGPEGIGKSTIPVEFMIKFVLGYLISVKAGVEPLKTSYNKILGGKLYVAFEELPTFSTAEWAGVSSKLKDMVTSDRMVYSDKYEKSFEAVNINNYVILSNFDAIQHSDGRRYFIADVSTCRAGDLKYWSNLRKECFNMEVGEAYFNYLLSIDTEGFYAQDMPETKRKRDAIVSLLSPEARFLKEEYLLKNRNLDRTKTSAVYANYREFCLSNSLTPKNDKNFFAEMRNFGLNHKAGGGYNWFAVPLTELKILAKKYKWIHELDEYPQDSKPEPIIEEKRNDELMQFKNKMLEDKIKRLEAELSLANKTNEANQRMISMLMKESKQCKQEKKDKQCDYMFIDEDVDEILKEF